MAAPRIIILRAPGANCDVETAFAFEQAGGVADRVHINRLLENPSLIGDYQILCIPGGFTYGDDVAAGRILANQIRLNLVEAIHEFKAAGKLILGICNGFQVLIKSGALLASGDQGPPATLTWPVAAGSSEADSARSQYSGSQSVFVAMVSMYSLTRPGTTPFVRAPSSGEMLM